MTKHKAEAFMDYENRPSGFARYGDGSTKGRRIVEEPISKGFFKPKAAKKTVSAWKDASGTKSAIQTAEHQRMRNPSGNLQATNRNYAPAGAPRAKGWGPVDKGLKLPKIFTRSTKAVQQTTKGAEIAPGVKYMGPSTVGMRGSQGVKKSQLVEVSKRIRNKDAEDDRQRRLGMGTAAAGVGSALLLRRGIGGSIKTTRALRGELNATSWKRLPKETRTLFTHTGEDGKKVKGKGFAHTGSDLSYTAAGTAAGAGAVTLDHYARGRRNRRWE